MFSFSFPFRIESYRTHNLFLKKDRRRVAFGLKRYHLIHISVYRLMHLISWLIYLIYRMIHIIRDAPIWSNEHVNTDNLQNAQQSWQIWLIPYVSADGSIHVWYSLKKGQWIHFLYISPSFMGLFVMLFPWIFESMK